MKVGSRNVDLARRETTVLEMLMRRSGRVVTKADLEGNLYGPEEGSANSVEASISRLRKRLGDAGSTVEIHTLRGVGYLLRAAQQTAA